MPQLVPDKTLHGVVPVRYWSFVKADARTPSRARPPFEEIVVIADEEAAHLYFYTLSTPNRNNIRGSTSFSRSISV